MIYPGTQGSFSVGQGNGGGDAKKRLIELLSRNQRSGALPLFGGRGRGANDLPAVGAPAIGFNPFLKMLAGRPGENFGIQGNQGIQNGPGPVQGGGAPGDPNNQGYDGSSVPTQGTSGVGAGIAPDPSGLGQPDPGAQDGYTGGHLNPGSPQPGGVATVNPAQLTGGNIAGLAGGFGQQTGATGFAALDPATQLFLLHLQGGLAGYNQDR